MAGRRTIVEILLQAKDLTGRAFTGAFGKLRDLRDQVFSLRTAVAGFAAFVATKVVGTVVKAFADQEAAVIRLNTALRVTGRYTEEGTKKIQAMSTEMQRLTTVSDEAALGISATLAQLATGLTSDQLAEAQRSVIGLSEAFGLDLQSAAQLVGKTLSGEMNALGRYGIQVDETASQQEKFNQIVRQTSGFFDVAVGATQSLAGQYAQAKNAAGELLETFGQIIATSFTLNETQGTVRESIDRVTASVRANMGEWVKWGRLLVLIPKAIGVTFFNLIKALFTLGLSIGELFNVAINGIGAAVEKLANFMVRRVNDVVLFINVLTGSSFKTLEQMPEVYVEATAEALDRLKGDIADNADAIRGLGSAWHDVADEMRKYPLPAAAFDISGAGGGSNRPQDSRLKANKQAQGLSAEAGLAVQRFQLGGMSTADFEATMNRLVPQLQALRDSGQLTQDMWVGVATAVQKFNEVAGEAGVLITSINDAGPATFGQAFAQRVHEASAALGTLNEQLATTAVDALGGFGQAAAEAFGLLAEGSQAAGQTFEAAMLQALSSVASAFAQMFAARGTAAIAEAILPSSVLTGQSAGGLAAAGYFFAAAAAMSAVAGALRGAAARTAGGAGGGGGAAGAESRTSENARETPPLTVVIRGNVNGVAPEFVDLVATAFGEATGRNIILIKEP